MPLPEPPVPPAWFPTWLEYHMKVVRRTDWPALLDPFWEPMIEGLNERRATESEAFAATKGLALAAPRFLDANRIAVLEAIDEARRADRLARPFPIEHACPECSGGGFAVRRFRTIRKEREVVMQAACWCPCGAGRRLMNTHREQKDGLRLLDLAERPDIPNLVVPPEWFDGNFGPLIDAIRDKVYDLDLALRPAMAGTGSR